MRHFKLISIIAFLASTLSSNIVFADTHSSKALSSSTLSSNALASNSLAVDDNTSVGSIYDITGDSKGMHFKMNVGLPAACQKASSERMLIKSNNVAAMMLISISLTARFITVTADYDAGSKTCVVRSVLLQTGSAQI